MRKGKGPKDKNDNEVENSENSVEEVDDGSTSALPTLATTYLSSTGFTNISMTSPNGVTQTNKQSDAGLIAGASVVGAIFLLVAAIVIYMCCCRCKKEYPRKNSTYQMYSEIDASQMITPGHLRTINSPLYGREDVTDKNDDLRHENSTDPNNVYDEIVDRQIDQQQPYHGETKWLDTVL